MPPKSATKSASPAAAPPEPTLDQNSLLNLVGYNLRQAYLLKIVPLFHKPKMAKYALRPVDYTILSLLKSNPSINQKRLAHAINVSPPNMAAVLDRLESRKLLTRQRNPLDKRAQTLALSPEGMAMCGKVEKALNELDLDATASLNADERRELMRLLQKMFMQ